MRKVHNRHDMSTHNELMIQVLCFTECAWDTRVSGTLVILNVLTHGLSLSWIMHHNCMLGLDCEQVLDVKKL